jgi:glycosyltransferase involved in cell wall biosynthesis
VCGLNQPIRVLHVLHRLRRAGAEMRTLEVIERVGRSRFHCDILLDSGAPDELDGRARELGCRLWHMRRGPAFGARFRRLLLDEGYRAVHSHVGLTSGAVVHEAAACGIPVRVAHLHNSRLSSRDSAARRVRARWMRSWIEHHATHIVGVSRGALASAWRSDWSHDLRCVVAYDGLDVAPFAIAPERDAVRAELGMAPESPLILHVGRVHPQKNHEWLVTAFAEIARELPAARLALVGDADGPAGARVRELVEGLGIASQVAFAGIRNDVPRLLRSADMLLFPSRWEGLPGVVLESCAAGLPVLASDIPGIPEIAEHFPRVRVLSLEAPRERWAQEALEQLAAGRVEPAGWEHWDSTPFTVEACARTMEGIWGGGGDRP